MLATIKKYFSLVQFSHTLFAMPFALIGYTYALTSNHLPFDWILLLKILLCMVLARNTAMGFNRWADRYIDAENPRTSGRDIPSGRITPTAALLFTIINAVGFIIVAAFINRLTLMLAPAALFIIMGYSYTKRFTALAHIVLGVSLAIAPVGAYIAVTGQLAIVPIILSGVVITWVGGFDILYSLQDAKYDREHNLHSIPARLNLKGAKLVSIMLHLITVYAVIILGMYNHSSVICWIGTVLFISFLIFQQSVSLPSRLDRIGAFFGIVNGISSLTYATFTIVDLIIN